MATTESISSKVAHNSLASRLTAVLPKGYSFRLYHVSTPPERSEALYSAPPGQRPDRTYCESHFLTISGNSSTTHSDSEVLYFAIEILIYSTAYSTTLFVSKADSTGYLHLLGLPKGTSSPVKEISSAFLAYLVEERRRPGIRTIVSLFARAQDQYLFPGSVENSGKHVLDDRRLVRWWCSVLNPLLESSKPGSSNGQHWNSIQGHLVVPGCDKYETMQFLPPRQEMAKSSWTVGHPLSKLNRHRVEVPPRCLIPHFPDDPKARFLDELDGELVESRGSSTRGLWKSVKSLDQFWEMMAFRQECSAGRMVGFIWVVFESKVDILQSRASAFESQDSVATDSSAIDADALDPLLDAHSQISSSPNSSYQGSSQVQPIHSPTQNRTNDHFSSQNSIKPASNDSRLYVSKKKKLTGHIIPRQPRIKTRHRLYHLEKPEDTPYYLWPSDSRGQIIVDEKDYKRITELLLRLDFANLSLAIGSSKRWINEVRNGSLNQAEHWGEVIVGARDFEKSVAITIPNGAANLSLGLVRKKRKQVSGEDSALLLAPTLAPVVAPKVNILGAGMIRKKNKG